MLRLLSGAALVMTALFATATMALSREWEAGEMNDAWQIVFTSFGDEGYLASYITNMDGSDVQPLIVQGKEVLDPDCSPDGNFLIFLSGDSLYILSADGNEFRRVQFAVRFPTDFGVSNDGRRVFVNGNYQSNTSETYIVDTLTSQWSTLANSVPTTALLDLSPDGSKIAFPQQQGTYENYIISVDGSNFVRMDQSVFQPAWSPDGNLIAFAANWRGASNIYIMDINRQVTARVTHLTDSRVANVLPSWSPDGQWITYLQIHNMDDLGYHKYVIMVSGNEQLLLPIPSLEINSACVLTARPTSLIANP